MVPSYFYISGWINSSDKATNQKIYENKMGNHGSKTISIVILDRYLIVKEQRIDVLSFINLIILRYILMYFEKNNQVRYFTNQIENRKSYYSTITNGIKLNPWFITGFSDAECSFIILIYKKSR